MLEKNKAPKYLYHYTNKEGLIGICSANGYLDMRMSSIECMNDTSEYNLVEKFPDIIHEIDDGGSNSFFSVMVGLFYEEIARLKMDFCIMSFSKKPNDLSQWRAYANRDGFCLKFDVSKFKYTESSPIDVIGFDECTYGDDECVEIIKNELLKIQEKCHLFKEKNKNLNDKELIRKFAKEDDVHSNVGELIRITALSKNIAFIDEAEWRLTARHLDEFYVNERHIVPCVHTHVDEGALVSIMVGPENGNFKTAEKLLSSRGFSAKVCASKIPYRG